MVAMIVENKLLSDTLLLCKSKTEPTFGDFIHTWKTRFTVRSGLTYPEFWLACEYLCEYYMNPEIYIFKNSKYTFDLKVH